MRWFALPLLLSVWCSGAMPSAQAGQGAGAGATQTGLGSGVGTQAQTLNPGRAR